MKKTILVCDVDGKKDAIDTVFIRTLASDTKLRMDVCDEHLTLYLNGAIRKVEEKAEPAPARADRSRPQMGGTCTRCGKTFKNLAVHKFQAHNPNGISAKTRKKKKGVK